MEKVSARVIFKSNTIWNMTECGENITIIGYNLKASNPDIKKYGGVNNKISFKKGRIYENF